jgi:hypothetical protein
MNADTDTSPCQEYEQRLAARRAVAAREAHRHDLIGHLRLTVFGVLLLLIVLALWPRWLSLAWAAVPLAGFVLLVAYHARVGRRRARAERAATFYERGIARLDDRWADTGQPGRQFLDPDHLYAADLDLFGTGSLYELLCTARTQVGEEMLASWLLRPAQPAEIRARQEAVRELSGRLDLREDLAVLGADVGRSIDATNLVAWGQRPAILTSPALRLVAQLLPLPTLVTLGLWLGEWTSSLPFVLCAGIQAMFATTLHRQVKAVTDPLEVRGKDLALLAGILARLEREPLAAPRSQHLKNELRADGAPPSRRIAELAHLIDWLDAGRNQLFLPVALLVLWRTRLAFAIDAWRVRSGPVIAHWLEALAEFESLASLAAYAFERPTEPFPEIADHGPVFEATALGHPLLPDARCVRNDLQLGENLRVLVVSGSNMSGKSTLLRTIGVNAVLALAGGPVRAKSLRLSPLALGATLRIQDSLQAGRSRFYAEVVRVRQIVELADGPLPLLFLLDEIFHGTNSHDRKQGAEAIVRGLVKRGAIGLVTTHDLALATIADQLGPRAANVHFADHMDNGEMIFDYRMQPGIVQHSNALALMRAVGLEV